LSYFVLPDQVALWIVTADGVRATTLALGAKTLGERVSRAEALVRVGEESAEWRALSRELFDALLAPAAAEIERRRELVIVADGALGRLPFAALRDSADRYLIERIVPIHAAAVPRTELPRSDFPNPVVVGYPSADARLFPELGELAGAVHEVDAVRRAHPGARVVVGEQATRDAVLRMLPSASLFHFAGHARLVPRAPTLSHLVLAKGDAAGLAGNVLSAADIARLDLRRMRLAILSSCGTQQARSSRDFDQSGLSRAFLAAGARAVISSRWEVDDAGTAELMRVLHAGLADGEPAAAALDRAQITLRGSRTIRRPLRVWAAFMYEER
jgi:CHAT domain-containing protein